MADGDGKEKQGDIFGSPHAFAAVPKNSFKKSKIAFTEEEKEENLRALTGQYEDHLVYDPFITTNNRFDGLKMDTEDSEESEDEPDPKRKSPRPANEAASEVRLNNFAKENKKPGLQKPPPITIKNLSIVQLEAKIKFIKIDTNNIKFQLNNHGIKIHTFNNNDFEAVKKFCIDSEIEFYTHASRDDKLTKIVLYGLPEFEIPYVLQNLNAANLFPTDIKKLSIRNQKYEMQCHFLLYFKKADNIKISKVREIRYLCNCVVRWEYYTHKRSGPTQCSNCQGFRHGTKNCFLKPKCIRCGEPHKSAECPLIDQNNPKSKAPTEKLRCANCGKNHVASFTGCPERMSIIKSRENSKFNGRKVSRERNVPGFVSAPQLDNFNFPALINGPSTSKAWTSSQANPVIQNLKKPIEKSNDLLSPEECYSVFTEFLNAISHCKTRMDQINVIGQITFKYLVRK